MSFAHLKPNHPAFIDQVLALWAETGETQRALAWAAGFLSRSTITNLKQPDRSADPESVVRLIFALYKHQRIQYPGEAWDLAVLVNLERDSLIPSLQDSSRWQYRPLEGPVDKFTEWLQPRLEEPPVGAAQAPCLPAHPPSPYVRPAKADSIQADLLALEAYRRPRHRVVVLPGPPGAGKTTLAAEIAQEAEVRRYFRDGVIWLPSATGQDRTQALWHACQQAGLGPELDEQEETLRRRFVTWANKEERLALLVFDGVLSTEDLALAGVIGSQVRLLITCRDADAVQQFLEEQGMPPAEKVCWKPLPGLSRDEGQLLLDKLQAGDISPKEAEARQEAGEMVKWNPAALRLCDKEARASSWQDVRASVVQGSLDPEDPFFLEKLRLWVQKRHDWETSSHLRRQFRLPETSHLVRRTGLSDRLKQLLLQTDDGPQAVVLWGTGGIGKTTLLRMLWSETEIQARFAFPLWAELGRDIDAPSNANKVEAQLHGWLSRWADGLSLSTANLSTSDDLSRALQTHLRPRRALLLLDDVWTRDSLQPFLIAGPRGRVVITTRNRTVLDGLQARTEIIEIPPMTLAEAQGLVEKRTGQEIAPQDPQLQALYERTEGSPMALNLAVSGVDAPDWTGVAEVLREDGGGLALFERGEGQSRHDSVRASYGLSYDRLRPEQQSLFRAMGVFPPTPFGAQAVHAVWSQKPTDEIARELDRLGQLSIVQAHSGSGGEPSFRLTPLWRSYALDLLRQQEELAECTARYVTYQTSQAETLHGQLHSVGEEVAHVMRVVCAELPHLDQAFGYACANEDVESLRRLLVSCPSLFKQAGRLELWHAWLMALSPWLAEDAPFVGQDEFLLVEWHLQYAALLLEQGDAETASGVLKKIRTRRLRHPAQKVRRPLTLVSLALRFGNDHSANLHLQRVEKLGYERNLRSHVLSLRAQVARRHRIPAFIVRLHGEALDRCRSDQDLISELEERLRLADSYRQFGWFVKAQSELEDVAAVAEQLELPALRLASLTRLAELCLDAGQYHKAAETIARLEPFCDAQTLYRLEHRLQSAPQFCRDSLVEQYPQLAQRIAIVGTSRAGKTTLAHRLSQCLGYPHVELDRLYWASGWTPAPAADFRASTRQALRGDCWIADGNCWEVRDIVWSRADLLVWLDYSRLQVVRQTFKRIVRRESTDHEKRKSLGQRILGDDSILIWAPRAWYQSQKEYPISRTIFGDERIHPHVIHLPSPRDAGLWLSDLLETRLRLGGVKPS